jgi:hypothetical protein
VLLSSFAGFAVPYGSSGFCNSQSGQADFLTVSAAGGGPSSCAFGNPAAPGVVGGSCQGNPKPQWQMGILGNPADGVRDLPDISLFASSGVWGHFYIICYSNVDAGGAPCNGPPSGWTAAGGTSFSAPILAGIQAIVNQHTNERWGNPNPIYYGLARAAYGSSGDASCNSSNGKAVNSSCVFFDVTQGDTDVNCTGNDNCYLPSGANGVLSVSSNAYNPVFRTGLGWDFATGIGTINAANLVRAWPSVQPAR